MTTYTLNATPKCAVCRTELTWPVNVMVGVSRVSPEGELLGGAYCAKAECK